MSEQIGNFQMHERMRAQDKRYIAAVYAAHPELKPPLRERITKITAMEEPKSPSMPQRPAEIEMTPEVIEALIKKLEAEAKPRWRPLSQSIIKAVSLKHGVSVREMKSPARNKMIARARQEAFYLLRQNTPLSMPQIGSIFSRDHTTVLHGIRRHAERIA